MSVASYRIPEVDLPEQGMSPLEERVADLQRALLDAEDPARRAQIHLELGGLAVRDGRLDAAARHFREALVHDPRSQAARRWLTELGAERRPERTGPLRALLSRISRRA